MVQAQQLKTWRVVRSNISLFLSWTYPDVQAPPLGGSGNQLFIAAFSALRDLFPLQSRAFSTNFCSTTFAQRVFNNTHSEWTFASAYASLSPPASSSSPALVGLIFETEHKSSYCLKEPSLSLIRSGGVSALANSVDNRDQSERLLQTDSIAGVEGHQHFSIWMTRAYISVR